MTIKKQDGFKDERHVIIPNTFEKNLEKHPLTQGTFLKELGYYPKARYHYRERNNYINDYILIYCLDGEGVVSFPHQACYYLNKGDVFVIPKNKNHSYYSSSDNPWSILWAHFNTHNPHLFFKELPIKISLTSPIKNSLIQNDFIRLFDLSEKNIDYNTNLCIIQLFNYMLVEISYLNDTLQQDKQNLYLSKSIKYLNDHLSENVSLNQLAEHVDISPSYLSSLYKKFLKKSPIEYFNEIKIEQACRYLKLSDLKIYEIANQLGFNDPFYFSRVFKKIVNLSPKEYRKKHYDFDNIDHSFLKK